MSEDIILSLDSETVPFDEYVAFPELVVLATTTQDEGVPDLYDWQHAGSHFYDASAKADYISGYNIGYDMGVICANYPELLPYIFQLYDANKIISSQVLCDLYEIAIGDFSAKRENGLAARCKRHLGVDVPKADTWRLRYGELRGVPFDRCPADAVHYVRNDVVMERRLLRHVNNLAGDLVGPDVFAQSRHEFWLQLSGGWGTATDPKAVEEYARSLEKLKAEDLKVLLEKNLVRHERGKFVKTPKLAQEYMVKVCTARGLSPRLTDKGGVSLDAEACEASADPVMEAYTRFANSAGMLSRLEPLKYPHVTTSYQTTLATGRTASRKGSKKNGVQAQNPPGEGPYRQCMVPRPGCLFIQGDYPAAELVGVGQLCIWLFGTSSVANAINSGKDLHLMLASAPELSGRSYEDLKANKATEEVQHWRKLGKVGNFGLWGGMGAETLIQHAWAGYRVELTLDQAQALKRAMRTTWAEFDDYLRLASEECEHGTIIQAVSGRVRGGCGYTQCANTKFQGLTADWAKAAGWEITKACYLPGGAMEGSRIPIFLHDEFVGEAREEVAVEHATTMARLMTEAAAKYCPNVKCVVEPALMRRWYKGADPVYHNGVLVPSKPVVKNDRIIGWEADL